MTTHAEELKRIAIETAYSSKGHFKTADWTSWSLASYVAVPMATSLIQALFTLPDIWDRALSLLGLLFSFLALTSLLASNRDRANRTIETHMDIGNKYLEIHKEIRILMANPDGITSEQLIELQRRVSELDRNSRRYRISLIGRLWSKMRIKEEMDLGWLLNQE